MAAGQSTTPSIFGHHHSMLACFLSCECALLRILIGCAYNQLLRGRMLLGVVCFCVTQLHPSCW